MNKKIKKAFYKFFTPTVVCAICNEKTSLTYEGLCCHCLEALAAYPQKYVLCDFCGNYYSRHFLSCPQCFQKKEPRSYCKVQAAYPYLGEAKELVWALKFKNGKYLGAAMAKLIHEAYDICEEGSYDALIAVPMTKKEKRNRNYNQAEELAKEIRDITGIPLLKNVLVKVRETKPQSSLKGAERWDNVKDAYALGKGQDIKGRSLILIDDVITTGATVHQCGKVLKKAGAKKIKVCTFCGTGKENP